MMAPVQPKLLANKGRLARKRLLSQAAASTRRSYAASTTSIGLACVVLLMVPKPEHATCQHDQLEITTKFLLAPLESTTSVIEIASLTSSRALR